MKSVTQYQAYDGTLFNDAASCIKYETEKTLVKRLNEFLKDDIECNSPDYDVQISGITKEEKLTIILESWKDIESLALELNE